MLKNNFLLVVEKFQVNIHHWKSIQYHHQELLYQPLNHLRLAINHYYHVLNY